MRVIIFIILLLFINNITYAYDTNKVHPAMNYNIAIKSEQLKRTIYDLDMKDGVSTLIKDKRIFEWLEDGGKKEDDAPRWVKHFHDPTKSWDRAGLKAEQPSSLLWAQQEFQDSWDTWSWPQAREYYLAGLTAKTLEDREVNLAKTFRSLGQVLHLLADSSVPAHVRNDLHPFGESYENFCKNNVKLLSFSAASIGTSITNRFSLPGLSPISNYWDTTPEEGENPNPLGLAEYTNRNFLSEGTIFTNYTFPRSAGLLRDSVKNAKGEFEDRFYLEGMTSDGIKIWHLASTGYLYEELNDCCPYEMDDSRYNLDAECYKDYAAILIPKAVAYGTGLLDYFFRGDIHLDAAPDNAGKYLIKNFTDEQLSGKFTLYIDDKNGNRTPVNGASWTTTIGANTAVHVDPFMPPIVADDQVKYVVVFQGQMGKETDMVIGSLAYVDQGPINLQVDPQNKKNLLIKNEYDKSMEGTVFVRYISSDGSIKEIPEASLEVSMAAGESVKVPRFFSPRDAMVADQYQVVIMGSIGQQDNSLVARVLTLPPYKPGFFEEWETGLTDSHTWLTTDIELLGQNSPNNGRAVSVVESGRLLKENIRYAGYKGARVNQTLIREVVPNSSGQYCVDSASYYCVPYDFGEEFPLKITPATVLRVKIDEMSVTSGIPHYNNCSLYTAGYGEYQGIIMAFSNGARLAFTLPYHEPPVNLVAYFTPGEEYAFNIFSALEEVGYPPDETLTLRSIDIVQQLGSLCDPAEEEQRQRISVDYIRLEEEFYGW